MNIKFYKTVSENNRVNKVLTNEISIDGTLRDELNILNPVVTFMSNVINFNYCYIEELHRYYYVESVIAIRHNYYMVRLSCDVLMTYKDEIRNIYANVERQENVNNSYINKGYSVESREVIEKYPFENKFTDGEYILITTRGGVS